MDILIARNIVSPEELSALAEAWHGDLVKGVADIERGVVALGGEWHMEANVTLLADGSAQENIWGFNVYPQKRGDDAIEYISLINVRPAQENFGMEIEHDDVKASVWTLVKKHITHLDL